MTHRQALFRLTNLPAMALALATLMGMACGAETEQATVVAFGDSTTAVRGNTTVYAMLLEDELRGVKVINAGVSGNTTAMARARFDKEVLAHKPKVVVVQFGINDAAVDVWKKPAATGPRVKLDQYVANMAYFIDTLKASGAQVIVMSPNPLRWTEKLKELYGKPPYRPEDVEGFNGLLVRYCEALEKVAREKGVTYFDLQAGYRAEAKKLGVEVDKLLQDGMHPNDEGHRMVANLLRAKILELSEAHKLGILPGPVWGTSGATVWIHPEAVDISVPLSDAASDKDRVMLGCGLAKLADGSMMAVYSTPSSYYAKPGQTWIAARVTKDGGKTWSAEQRIASQPNCQPSHPSILRARDGTLHVFYLAFKTWKWKGENPTPEAQSDVYAVRSADEGRTWSEPQPIFDGYSGATNGAVETRDGTLLVPYSHYVNDPGRLVSRVSISNDKGKTWTLGQVIDIGGAGDHEGALEPSLLELQDGRVWMLIRTTRGHFWNSYSSDGGKTWTKAEAGNIPATSAPGHMARLQDGRLALVWNPKAKGRRELHVAVSADDGTTWAKSQMIAKGKSVTYPFVLEGAPGELWVGYHDVPKGWNFPRARYLKVRTPK